MKILEANILPVCKFPTTVFLLDDDAAYTNTFKLKQKKQFLIRTENNSIATIEFFTKHYHPQPFLEDITSQSRNNNIISVSISNLSNIHKLIYNPTRFEYITVLICDYAMPETTGVEVIQKINETNIEPKFRSIVLTGIYDEPEKIIGEIDAFFEKSDAQDNLVKTMLKSQDKFFIENSLTIINLLVNDKHNRALCFQDPKFIELVNKYMEDHKIVEYYLLDNQGSLLFLDAEANLSWLLVKNDNGIQESIKAAQNSKIPNDVLIELQHRKKLFYTLDGKELLKNLSSFQDYLHPIEVLHGQEKYYYAFVRDLKHFNIEKDKITSYNKYLASTAQAPSK